jgi:hypothetical protein
LPFARTTSVRGYKLMIENKVLRVSRVLSSVTLAIQIGFVGLLASQVQAHDDIEVWGDDAFGQVSSAPSGGGFVQIAGGDYHSLGLRVDGSIESWGHDFNQQVSNTPTTTGFTQAACGSSHSLALRADGSIESWGYNAFGQVTDTPPGPGFVQVASRGRHSLALRAGGLIETWGLDNYGQVSAKPTGSGFEQLAGGAYHSLALHLDGSITSWGVSDGGQEDRGQVTNSPSGNGYMQVAGGDLHSLALRADGSIKSWGDDTYGQLSNAPLESGFVQIAAGGFHSMALRANGTIVSWGINYAGIVLNSPAGGGFTQIAGGHYHSLGLHAPALINMAEYLPVAPGYSWKAVVPSCPDACSCTAVDIWDVLAPHSAGTGAYQIGPASGEFSMVVSSVGGSFTFYGIYVGPMYFPAIGGPYVLDNLADGYFFRTDAQEEIMVRDWDFISHADKALYGIPAGLTDLVVWVYYDLNPAYSKGSHDAVMESGLAPGTSISAGTVTAISWLSEGEGFAVDMDVDAGTGSPWPPQLDSLWTASLDCNGNGLFDRDDIANMTSADANANCIPDECEGMNIGSSYCYGDGSGIFCPCGNYGNIEEGCANSGGSGGATLAAAGNAQVSNDTFQLDVAGVPGNKPGLILRGDNQVSIPAGFGVLCTAGNSLRSQVQVTVAGTTSFTQFNGAGFGSVANTGSATQFQFWYRDPAATCATALPGFNFTNGWTVTWTP